jgi:extracellular factor (EF) 3-hydroxypalmitic acid methyl ester biosynthesis protein
VASNRASLQSFVGFRNSQGEAGRGTLLKLEHAEVVFEVYNPYSIVQLSEVLQEITIRRGDRVIYQGRAVVSNLVNTGLMLIVSASLLDIWSEGRRFDADIEVFRQEASQFIAYWGEARAISKAYRLAVTELCSFLAELNQWLEQLDINSPESADTYFPTYDDIYDFAAPIMHEVARLGRNFERQAGQIRGPEVGRHKAYLQRELHPLVMRAPFPYRTYHKPLGYAGDYEMMNMIHREKAEGPNTYARFVNAVYVGLPIAECVRNRARTLQDYLARGARSAAKRGRDFRVMSIGCGPAIEVQRFIKQDEMAGIGHFSLLDFNAETLDYAERMIRAAMEESGCRPTVEYFHESVNFLLKSAVAGTDDRFTGQFDLVYCAGLFDYLSDRVCSRLLRLFFVWLRPAGTILVTNMHIGNPHRHILEHGAEWYLIHRDEGQMLGLIPGTGRQRAFTDDTGVNLCLEVRKLEQALAKRI